jgi:hypothetical protein
MGKASSRPVGARRRARGDACCGARAERVDVEGIAAERAAEGSGSEWSTSEPEAAEEEDEETTAVVSSSESAGATAGDTTALPLLASSAPAPSIPARIPASPIHRHYAASPVKLFLSTDEPGQERPVIARLFVADDPSRPRPEPPTQRTISDTLRQHAGDWPAWDLRQSAKAKTTVAVQREDWTNTLVWDIREPPHDTPFVPPPPDTTQWTVDLTPRERAARWKYQGGGMHQPVEEPEHLDEKIEEEKKTNVAAGEDPAEESHFPFEPETCTPAEAWMSSRTSKIYDAATTSSSSPSSSSPSSPSSNDSDAVAVNAKQIDAEVALAMDGERGMSPRAKAAAAAVARAAARAVPVHIGESSTRTSGEKRRRDRSRSRSRSPPPSARTQTPSTPRRDAEVRWFVGVETPTSESTTPSRRRRRRRRVQRTSVDVTRREEDTRAEDVAEVASAAGVPHSRARGGEQPTPRELIERGKRAAARLSFAARAMAADKGR